MDPYGGRRCHLPSTTPILLCMWHVLFLFKWSPYFHIISHVFFASGELCWLCQSIPFLQCSSISYTIYMILNACQMRCWLDNPTIYCLDVPVEIWASCNWGSGANGGSQNLEIRRTLLVMIENDYCMFPKWRGGSFFKVFFYVSNLTHIFQMGGSTPN